MKKFLKKLVAIVLVLACASSLLTACSSKNTNPTESSTYDPEKGINRKVVLSQMVKDGSSDYRIVYSAEATATEVYAAQEMQLFIYESTGANLPIVTDGMAEHNPEKLICIGRNSIASNAGITVDVSELKEDGFILKTKGTNLYIMGGGNRGTLYGVYDWLEKILGIRFLDSEITHIPEHQTVDLYSMNVKEIPYFEYRGVLATSSLYGADPAFYARTRNTHEHILQHVVNLDEKYGGTIEWYSDINPTHNTLNYVSLEKYFKTAQQQQDNAHMYAQQGILTGGTRDICFTDGITPDGKLDESMELSALKAAIESLKSYVQADPDCYHMFGHMDTGDMCNCDDCLESHDKYGRTGTYFRFANALLRETQKWADEELDGKQIKLVVFAYSASAEAPVKVNTQTGKYEIVDESVRPIKNMTVRLAPIHANRYFSMSEGKHMIEYKDWLEKWDVVADDFMVWAYTVDFHRSMWYFPTHQSIVKTLKEYKELGVNYMMLQAIWQEENDWQSIMKNYVYLKLLWNPNRDVNALIEEFCYLYYGEIGGESVLKMIDLYDQYFYLAIQATDGDFTSNYMTFTNPLYNKYEHVYAGYELIENAIQAVGQDQSLTEDQINAYVRRLKVVKLTPLFMIAYNYEDYFMGDSTKQERWINEFLDLCRELKVVYIGENTGSQTEYLLENFVKYYWGYEL